jgi:4'-phosphopantetheinyl transferase
MIALPDANVVHVWDAACDAGAWRQATDESAMSGDERARADRFIDERARRRFIAGRLSLRHVLAGYLDVAAAAIRFDTSPLGKPRLGHPHARSGIHFNISHSGDLILLGIARCEIGLDVEEVGNARFNDNLIRRVFSAREQALIELSPDPQRTCFQLWVRKEASVKATGMGLVSKLASLDVSEGTCATPAPDGRGQTAIRCFDLSVGSIYAAAVASSAATEVRRIISLSGRACDASRSEWFQERP